jgi:hypothetical protein
VELLHEHTKGRCWALEAEVPPDHTLAQPYQVLVAGTSNGNARDKMHRLVLLLLALNCSYVQLPCEEVSARLMPEDERVRALGGSLVQGSGPRPRAGAERGQQPHQG